MALVLPAVILYSIKVDYYQKWLFDVFSYFFCYALSQSTLTSLILWGYIWGQSLSFVRECIRRLLNG